MMTDFLLEAIPDLAAAIAISILAALLSRTLAVSMMLKKKKRKTKKKKK